MIDIYPFNVIEMVLSSLIGFRDILQIIKYVKKSTFFFRCYEFFFLKFKCLLVVESFTCLVTCLRSFQVIVAHFLFLL